MAHEWKDITREKPIPVQIGSYGFRRCSRCGVEQERVADTLWGRVVRYHWYPKAGRHAPARTAKSIYQQRSEIRAKTV